MKKLYNTIGTCDACGKEVVVVIENNGRVKKYGRLVLLCAACGPELFGEDGLGKIYEYQKVYDDHGPLSESELRNEADIDEQIERAEASMPTGGTRSESDMGSCNGNNADLATLKQWQKVSVQDLMAWYDIDEDYAKSLLEGCASSGFTKGQHEEPVKCQ